MVAKIEVKHEESTNEFKKAMRVETPALDKSITLHGLGLANVWLRLPNLASDRQPLYLFCRRCIQHTFRSELSPVWIWKVPFYFMQRRKEFTATLIMRGII